MLFVKKYKISLWTYADCIIPNILLGQMIGRWGNFFNHELLGKEISDPTTGFFSWLPAFIRNNAKTDGSGPFREPIFLY